MCIRDSAWPVRGRYRRPLEPRHRPRARACRRSARRQLPHGLRHRRRGHRWRLPRPRRLPGSWPGRNAAHDVADPVRRRGRGTEPSARCARLSACGAGRTATSARQQATATIIAQAAAGGAPLVRADPAVGRQASASTGRALVPGQPGSERATGGEVFQRSGGIASRPDAKASRSATPSAAAAAVASSIAAGPVRCAPLRAPANAACAVRSSVPRWSAAPTPMPCRRG